MVVATLISCTSALCVKLIGDRVPLFEVVVRRPAWLRLIMCPRAACPKVLSNRFY